MKGLAKTVDDNVLKDANSCFQYGILEIYDCQGLGLQHSLDDETLLCSTILTIELLIGMSNAMRVFLTAHRLDSVLSIYNWSSTTLSMYTAKMQVHMRLHKVNLASTQRKYLSSRNTLSHILEAEVACTEMLQVYGNPIDELMSEALYLATSLKACFEYFFCFL
ncbi:unnamed protein product [Albugo candida]|uniref:Uncharacterized protein n=1 Tax=Albugo candida TaxID=65357 RepID=A0A024FVL8_9STRA|nr:unnamed protein product [Albugo candida]|eukprot:CCI11170.1 unnamed protein product [Albugo candida]